MDDHGLLERLRAGDEDAFRALVERHNGALRRVARTFVRTSSAADEVVQETWLAVVRGLSAFEGRSSLRTWIFRILVAGPETFEKTVIVVHSMPEPIARAAHRHGWCAARNGCYRAAASLGVSVATIS